MTPTQKGTSNIDHVGTDPNAVTTSMTTLIREARALRTMKNDRLRQRSQIMILQRWAR
jgi:hypothetical protein